MGKGVGGRSGKFARRESGGGSRCGFEGSGGVVGVAWEGGGIVTRGGTTENLRVTNVTLVMYPNAPLAYAPALELYHLIMSELGGNGFRLEIER